MDAETPGPEHQWLHGLAGDWVFEGECRMGPDHPPTLMTGRATGRLLGGLWALVEGANDGSDHAGASLITLGFDASTGRFVGSFIASMTGKFWLYSGSLDAAGRELVLDARGPRMDGAGDANYQDIVAFDDDGWTLRSRFEQSDGSWYEFMSARYRRATAT